MTPRQIDETRHFIRWACIIFFDAGLIVVGILLCTYLGEVL